jgi:sarcosine oxidase, subunit delta
MKIMTCPINGKRPISEFYYWGAIRNMPDPDNCIDDEWAAYIYNRNGAPAIKKEFWCHTPSNTWFVAERDTQADLIINTYLFVGEK